MNTLKSIASIAFLVCVGIAIGQTSVGRGLYNETVFWMTNNPINSTVKSAVTKTKQETVKVQKKIQREYQEIKEKVQEKIIPENKEVKIPKTHNGMRIVDSKVKGNTIFIVADKDGYRCESFSNPRAKYSRCYKKISSK